MEAAFEVFADVGYEAATVEQVCTAAGFTRGAFYSSFETKEELFFALWTSVARSILDELSVLVSRLDQASEEVEATIDDVVLQVSSNRQWFLVGTELALYCMRHEDAAAIYAAHRRELRVRLAGVVAAIWERRGTPRSGAQAERCARQLIAAVEGAQRQTWLEPDELADGSLQVDMVRTLLA